LIGGAAVFTLAGYEFIRSVSSSVFIDTYGAQNLPYVMALSPIGTLLMIWVYGLLLSRVGARRALVVSTVASAVGIVAIWAGVTTGFRLSAALLYIFREAYIVLLIEQYWSYVNSTLNERQAARLNGPICGLGSVGAIAGGLLVARFAAQVGTDNLLLVTAATLIPAAAFSLIAYRVGGDPVVTEGASGTLGLGEFRKIRPLYGIIAVVLLTQVVSAVLDLAFNQAVAEVYLAKDARTAFFGEFYATLNAAAFVLQFFVAPILLRLVSLRNLHFAMPAAHVVAAVALLAMPTLTVAAGAFLLFKAIDYSIFRASKEMLYIPMTYNARFRAKELIDAFGYRAGKGIASGGIAAAGLLIAPVSGVAFPICALAACGGWLVVANRLTGKTSGSA
jgi:AAA family ATP:ADP antiporter